jgi:hypothetical protein
MEEFLNDKESVPGATVAAMPRGSAFKQNRARIMEPVKDLALHHDLT